MNIVLNITYAFVAVLALCNLVMEYARVLMMMQQNSYRVDRYSRWLHQSADTTSYPRLFAYCVLFGALAIITYPLWGAMLVGVYSAGSFITLLNRKYKKPLVWTQRVRRNFMVMCGLSVIVMAYSQLFFSSDGFNAVAYNLALTSLLLFCASHIVVVASIMILHPVEKKINKRYYDDAARILASVPGLKVIGITGSYGKTSTKHYLNRILSEQFEVLMTPGSYNTTLGVVRTVRELMKPYCEVFICEMGAKQNGDIKEICDLVHPSIGIITAVGPQHLESFGSIENVQATKFELVDSLPSGGLAVINNDFQYIASRKVENVECIRYGVSTTETVQYRAVDITYSASGTQFALLTPEGEKLIFNTQLLGECNVSNLISSIVVAIKLGMSIDKIKRAVQHITPVEHRLSMKRTATGITIIDDAFNSNPTGSAMALDVLSSMTQGRRVVVTPGMIELGDSQYELNFELGAKIATTADVAIVVGEYNRQAIVEGIKSRPDMTLQCIEVSTFAEAQSCLNNMLRKDDTVLYENDLPDTFK